MVTFSSHQILFVNFLVVRRGIEPHQGNLFLGFGTNPHYAYLTMLGGLMSGFPHLFLLCISLPAKVSSTCATLCFR